MAGATVRVSEETRNTLRELASQSGLSMQAVLSRAVEEYRRQRFFEDLERGFAALRADPRSWTDELGERSAWDVALADGLDSE